MTESLFDTPAPAPVPRDGRKRPLVVPPWGGKPVAYTRCTTFVDCLEDKYHLELWKQRQVAVGLSDRPDLVLAASAHRDDKHELNSITAQAMEAAASSARATTGTAVHRLCERVDRGEKLGFVPSDARADVEAYRDATAEFEHMHIEEFSVQDQYKIGGTPDRVVKWMNNYYIADIKTGSNIELGAMKIAMQLAVYRYSSRYDPSNGRRPYGFDLDPDRAIVIHVPAGEGRAELHFVNIALGWEAVRVAFDVRKWRAHKDWYEPIPHPNVRASALQHPDVAGQIAAATTVDELRQVWVRAVADSTWEDGHVAHAAARRAELERAS